MTPFFNSKSLGEPIQINEIQRLRPIEVKSLLSETEDLIDELETALAKPGDFNRHRINTKLRMTYAARNQCLLALGQEIPPSGYAKVERAHDTFSQEVLIEKLINTIGLARFRQLEREAKQAALQRLEEWAKAQSDVSDVALRNYINSNRTDD